MPGIIGKALKHVQRHTSIFYGAVGDVRSSLVMNQPRRHSRGALCAGKRPMFTPLAILVHQHMLLAHMNWAKYRRWTHYHHMVGLSCRPCAGLAPCAH